jgi:hypothetical protein
MKQFGDYINSLKRLYKLFGSALFSVVSQTSHHSRNPHQRPYDNTGILQYDLYVIRVSIQVVENKFMWKSKDIYLISELISAIKLS